MRPATKTDKLEIGILYGFRALMILFVMNYHLWQQSWINQSVTVFGYTVGFDFWTRSSYLFVDGMILMSGFLLYLPYARAEVEGTRVPSFKRFYFNRVVRILPSYLFAVLSALVFIALPQGHYATVGAMLKDVFSHLTFTFLFSVETYVFTPLNVALWTIAVEVQFYLIFPLLVRAMKKHKAVTAIAMMAAGWVYRICVAQFADDTTILINQMPAFLDVYALGMLGAAGFCRLRVWLRSFSGMQKGVVQAMSVMVFGAGVCVLISILKAQSQASSISHASLRLSQMAVRLPLAITLGLMMFAAAFWPRILQKTLDNRLMRFLSTISMNLYIWHQTLAVQMRLKWFPNTEMLHYDRNQQAAYMLLCASVAVLAAMAVTYGLEQPVSKWANKHCPIKE